MYIYLLDKYQWKLKQKDCYIFTKRELLGILGYETKNISSTDMSYGIVSDNLDSLYREGALIFEVVKMKDKMENGREVLVERLKLTWIAEALEELRPVPVSE